MVKFFRRNCISAVSAIMMLVSVAHSQNELSKDDIENEKLIENYREATKLAEKEGVAKTIEIKSTGAKKVVFNSRSIFEGVSLFLVGSGYAVTSFMKYHLGRKIPALVGGEYQWTYVSELMTTNDIYGQSFPCLQESRSNPYNRYNAFRELKKQEKAFMRAKKTLLKENAALVRNGETGPIDRRFWGAPDSPTYKYQQGLSKLEAVEKNLNTVRERMAHVEFTSVRNLTRADLMLARGSLALGALLVAEIGMANLSAVSCYDADPRCEISIILSSRKKNRLALMKEPKVRQAVIDAIELTNMAAWYGSLENKFKAWLKKYDPEWKKERQRILFDSGSSISAAYFSYIPNPASDRMELSALNVVPDIEKGPVSKIVKSEDPFFIEFGVPTLFPIVNASTIEFMGICTPNACGNHDISFFVDVKNEDEESIASGQSFFMTK